MECYPQHLERLLEALLLPAVQALLQRVAVQLDNMRFIMIRW